MAFPLARQALGAGDLLRCHVDRDLATEAAGLGASLEGGEVEPFAGDDVVLVDPLAGGIYQAKVELSLGRAMIGGVFELPRGSALNVGYDDPPGSG